ncbi:hypothetical protein CPB83DRAFT_884036 [Crepidotus variabilis]|uniref:F-box domain-containing protein n=1 Tax=Crepidotus variabilis TaxID=179855 RepID=A0A9P6JNP8_9AGAR|nr:hypothetical protein CPB83DRAFT_884036 [Crepidotus variabilis]
MSLLRTSAHWWHFITSRVISSPLYVFSLLRKLHLFRSLSWSTPTSKDVTSKSSQKVLQELPVELLTELMRYLEWYEVLSLRQTCKRIHAASQERAIWLTLLQRYIKTVEPRAYWPDRPLNFYNSQELESLVLRRHQVASSWSKPDSSPSLHRQFLAPNRRIKTSYLVRGGRWFLVTNTQGDILYFDLDDTEATARILIPSRYPPSTKVYLHMSVDMDNDAPFLTFNLAAQVQCYVAGHQNFNSLFQIWRITPKINECGRIVDLVADNKASFMEEKDVEISRLSLHGSYITYSIEHCGTGRRFTCVVDWTMTSETSLSYRRNLIAEMFDWVTFLPDNWLICNRDAYLHLYHLSDLPETTLPISQCIRPNTSPRRELALYSRNFSEAFTVRDSQRHVFSTCNKVMGIIFPHQNPVDAEVVTLYQDGVLLDGAQLAYNFAASMITEPKLSILHYSWPEIGTGGGATSKEYTLLKRPHRIHLDEVSGRLVISGGSGQVYNVVEFSI